MMMRIVSGIGIRVQQTMMYFALFIGWTILILKAIDTNQSTI